jgi:uncharacterized membrane protein (UPF0136 family)
MQLSVLFAAGLVLLWVGERILENPTSRGLASGLGALLLLGATAARFLRSRSARAEERPVQRVLLALHGLGLLAVALYALQSDLFTKATGGALSSSAPVLAGALGVLWPAALALSLLPTLLVELSFASMARAPTLEAARIREALLSGVGLSCALIFAFSVQYVASEHDAKVDLSYFRVAKAGEATKKLAASLDEKLEVFLFFPPASDSADAVAGYFDELTAAAPQVTVARLDHALEPVKAKELGVSGNGTVVLRMGGRKESLFIGIELEKARTQLSGLDGEVQKRILQVAKNRRTVYFTGGHGERTREPSGSMDQRATVEILEKTLKDQNFDVRVLSSAEGLGQEVPKDAAAVFVIGPSRPFSPPEAEALVAYGKRGGRLFIALDPESGLGFEELVGPLGLSFTPQPLAQERGNANVRPPPGPADRVNIATRTFSSHPVVTYLGRGTSPVLFLAAGGLEELAQHPADLVIDFAVRSLPDAWNDASGNFEFDKDLGETKKAWGVVAAVKRSAPSNKAEDELRALVLGDSDGVADLVLPQLVGNQYLVVDGFKWLLGDEQLTGVTNTEVDVPLTRTRQQDSAWFYGTTFAAPLAVAGLGLLARRRPKKPSKKESTS